jgi:L-lysine 2,3-aminomutase
MVISTSYEMDHSIALRTHKDSPGTQHQYQGYLLLTSQTGQACVLCLRYRFNPRRMPPFYHEFARLQDLLY